MCGGEAEQLRKRRGRKQEQDGGCLAIWHWAWLAVTDQCLSYRIIIIIITTLISYHTAMLKLHFFTFIHLLTWTVYGSCFALTVFPLLFSSTLLLYSRKTGRKEGRKEGGKEGRKAVNSLFFPRCVLSLSPYLSSGSCSCPFLGACFYCVRQLTTGYWYWKLVCLRPFLSKVCSATLRLLDSSPRL